MRLPHGARGNVTKSLRSVPFCEFNLFAIRDVCNTLVHNELQRSCNWTPCLEWLGMSRRESAKASMLHRRERNAREPITSGTICAYSPCACQSIELMMLRLVSYPENARGA
jgi:hypothetical protein